MVYTLIILGLLAVCFVVWVLGERWRHKVEDRAARDHAIWMRCLRGEISEAEAVAVVNEEPDAEGRG